MTLLSVDELSVAFAGQDMPAVSGVSFTIDEGEVTGLVGESGCGKSVTSLALMGLLPKKGVRVGGRADFDGTDLLGLRPAAMRELRGRQLAMIFQDPLSSLNPVVPIGVQVTEILARHRGMRGSAARKEAAALLDRVGIPDPTRRLKEYPHQLSGGMRQRALIAMAVACAPRLLIADEPTTALDVTIQAQILELLRELVDQQGTALLMITHDLGVVAGLCDRVNVLYAGKVVESAARRSLFATPVHPYAHGLLGSIPRLDAPRGEPLNPVRGSINDTIAWTDGCAFAPRCDVYTLQCLEGAPPLTPPSGLPPDHQVRCVNPILPTPDGPTTEAEPEAEDGTQPTADGSAGTAPGAGLSASAAEAESPAEAGQDPAVGSDASAGAGRGAGPVRPAAEAESPAEAGPGTGPGGPVAETGGSAEADQDRAAESDSSAEAGPGAGPGGPVAESDGPGASPNGVAQAAPTREPAAGDPASEESEETETSA